MTIVSASYQLQHRRRHNRLLGVMAVIAPAGETAADESSSVHVKKILLPFL